MACAPEAIIGLTTDSRIQLWNREAQRLLGYSAEEAIGQCIQELLAAPSFENWANNPHPLPRLETAWRAKNGTWQPICATVFPARSPDGHPLGWCLFARPMPPENATLTTCPNGAYSKNEAPAATAELELRRLYEQTRLDAETKTGLLREINHRVKNNLISILGLIQAEQLYTPDKASQPIVKEALGHLSQRVRGLIEVHHLLSETQWQPMRLSELADRIIGAVACSLGPSKQVVVQVADSPVRISPRQANSLALALNELATNTLKYAAAGRMMTKVSVNIETNGDFIRLEYRDDGPGFPTDILQRQRQGVGLNLLHQLAAGAFRGTLTLHNDRGAVAVLSIKAEEIHRT